MTRRGTAHVIVAGVVLAGLTAAPALAQNQRGVTHPCDRACLTRVVDLYVAGLLANDPSRVPLAPNARLTLNDDVVSRPALTTSSFNVSLALGASGTREGSLASSPAT